MDLPGAAALGGDPAGDLPQRHGLALARPLADAQLHGRLGQVVLMSPAPVIGAGDGREGLSRQVGGGPLAPGEQVEPGPCDVGEQGRGPAAPVKAHRHPPPLAHDGAQIRQQAAQLPASESDGSATTMNTGSPCWPVTQVSIVAGAGNFSRATCVFCTCRVP